MGDDKQSHVATNSNARLRIASVPSQQTRQRRSLQLPLTTRHASERTSDGLGEELDIAPELPGTLRWRGITEKNDPSSPIKASSNAVSPEARKAATREANDNSSIYPPSFAQSEFETIIRRQRTNPNGLKVINIPLRFPTLDNDWEFAVSTF